jgi:LmbE family N-acetylglucosaminyl deacetylase
VAVADPTVVFFHAHPDDEAIFTGGTMRLLASAGVRIVLVLATRGEQGEIRPGSEVAGPLGEHRWTETEAAARLLGVDAVHSLGYEDSGMGTTPSPHSFAASAVHEAADRLSSILEHERAQAFVTYDVDGIYGHIDHVHAHTVGSAACTAAGIATTYDVTVDREYLHFVETHLVTEAGHDPRPEGLGLAGTTLGMPSVMITATVDVRSVLEVKRAAMAAHASQIPETSSAMRLGDGDFGAVYGYEWFARRGPEGPIEALPLV